MGVAVADAYQWNVDCLMKLVEVDDVEPADDASAQQDHVYIHAAETPPHLDNPLGGVHSTDGAGAEDKPVHQHLRPHHYTRQNSP